MVKSKRILTFALALMAVIGSSYALAQETPAPSATPSATPSASATATTTAKVAATPAPSEAVTPAPSATPSATETIFDVSVLGEADPKAPPKGRGEQPATRVYQQLDSEEWVPEGAVQAIVEVGSRLNVRCLPDTSSRVFAKLANGEAVWAGETTGDWTEVYLRQGLLVFTGYVSSAFLSYAQ